MFTTEHAKVTMKELVERFENGDIAPLVQLSTIKLTSSNSIPSSRWSFSNQFMAYLQTGEIDCRGFRQWQEVKRHVSKGANAAYILAPIVIKEKRENKDERKVIGFKSVPVFPSAMTEGEPLPEIDTNLSPATLPPLVDVAEKWNIDVKYVPFNGQEYGSFSLNAKNIRLATHEEKVFFHELAHAAHSKIENLKGGQDARQETIAEFTACVLMQVYGLKDTTGHTWNYIKSYNPENPVKAILNALDTIGKVLDMIITTAAGVDRSQTKVI
jgi:hypothetical protein